jgi:hypothetical protein
MAVRHEAVQESVPEAAKNLLLVLASSGILTPDWKVSGQAGGGTCCKQVQPDIQNASILPCAGLV